MAEKRIDAAILIIIVVVIAAAAAIGGYYLGTRGRAGGGETYRGGPILIHSNNQFTSANGVVSGSGTQSDPYIIESWAINASSANGIDIENTTAYFVIRNCQIENSESGIAGIVLINVINGTLDNNTSSGNLMGIRLISSSNNTLTGNTCENNHHVGIGIYLSYSSSNNISNNTCGHNVEGIVQEGSNFNILDHNTCDNNTFDGILLDNSSNNTLTSNICSGNPYGIHLDNSSDNNTLSGNNLLNNTTNYIDNGANNHWSNMRVFAWYSMPSGLGNEYTGSYVAVLISVSGPQSVSGMTTTSSPLPGATDNFLMFNLTPGTYTVSGTYKGIFRSENATVVGGETVDVFLNFGEGPPPP